ncbi:four-carbon acid sugar kinase family protein [Paraburkholderia ginsengisoli]|uniref:Four-carbon acid sugar kinase family protein n=1 Tax=Paraburkholderia ginsengisoli TaxID=311231 RepID=A0A7T4N707_9BURK|nr:four-carbon acid sugar kinase family protein [Paraburkholderia ginsengisoli]QQC66427.1 four-carbon acid sugar kinase family protein [Paraburkholderia ginsengisoli]
MDDFRGHATAENTSDSTTEAHRTRPAYAFYGDDFTGATDTLAHLARAGLRTMLLFAPPDAARLSALGQLDALGVAGAARTMQPHAQRQELARVGAAFAALGVRVMHYKVCSTFDSAPQTGSIGVAIRTLRAHCANELVAVIGGQPNLRRYCVFGELFAAAGADDQRQAIYRIDRHPTMSRHPVTPMHEADLRVHLQRQGVERVQSIDWRCYAAGDAALQAEVSQRLESKPDALLFDVLDDTHLQAIGRVIARHAAKATLLAVGASSVAQAYASTFAARAQMSAVKTVVPLARARGPVFVLAGSLSPLTEVQIDAAHSYLRVELDPQRMSGGDAAVYLAERVAAIVGPLRDGRNVLAFTTRRAASGAKNIAGTANATAATDTPHAANAALPPLAHACAMLLREVLDAVRLQRIGIAGGDTSSFAVRALDAWGLSYLAPLSAGVTVCRLHADRAELDGMEIMLKGGQMGDAELFEQLVDGYAMDRAVIR